MANQQFAVIVRDTPIRLLPGNDPEDRDSYIVAHRQEAEQAIEAVRQQVSACCRTNVRWFLHACVAEPGLLIIVPCGDDLIQQELEQCSDEQRTCFLSNPIPYELGEVPDMNAFMPPELVDNYDLNHDAFILYRTMDSEGRLWDLCERRTFYRVVEDDDEESAVAGCC